MLHKLYNKIGIKSDRTKNITKHLLVSFIFKGGSILASFLLVPITMNYLDTKSYGLWLILSSFISWFYFFDIGLGNGLQNMFAEAKAKDDMTLARGYVSTAYFTIAAVSTLLLIVFLGANFFIDWSKIFNSSAKLASDLNYLMPVLFGLFCLQLVVKLITTIYTADQNHSMQGKINFYTQAISLLAIWLLTFTEKNSLLVFGIVFSTLPVLILLGMNFFAFGSTYKQFLPSILLWKKEYLKDIFGLGFKFFLIQMAMMILYSTDNFIIAQLYGTEAVVPYNIVYKYFSASNMVLTMIIVPYWSSITEAFVKEDFVWLRKSLKSLIKIAMVSMVLLIAMLLLSPWIYKIWIGDKVSIPFFLSLYTSLYFAINIFCNPFNVILNGTAKIKLQLYSFLVAGILNIPLSIFLAKNMNFGVSGVIIATTICLIPFAIMAPIQVYKIINKKAVGIWNK